MVPSLLKLQKSTLITQLSKSYHTTSSQVQPLPKFGGARNVPQPKASGNPDFPLLKKTPFKVVKRLMEGNIFMKTPLSVLSDDKYWIGNETCKIVCDAHDYQQAWVGAPVGTPYWAIAQWYISQYWSASMKCFTSWILFDASLSEFQYWLQPESKCIKTADEYDSITFGR